MFSNYFTTLKESEKSILEEALTKAEEEQSLKANQSEQNLKNVGGAPPGKAGGKADPKKDPKAAAAAKKGGAVEDKNAPKNI